MATVDTKRWRKARKTAPRDLSPMPESIPTPYKKLRAPDQRTIHLQDMEARYQAKAAAEGRDIQPREKAIRRTMTKVEVTAEDLNKVFFERGILLDKLARRSDEVRGLRAALAGHGQ